MSYIIKIWGWGQSLWSADRKKIIASGNKVEYLLKDIFFLVKRPETRIFLHYIFIFTTCYAWVWHCHSERLTQKCCDNKSNFEAKFNFQIKLCDKRHNRLGAQINGNIKEDEAMALSNVWINLIKLIKCTKQFNSCTLKQNKPQSWWNSRVNFTQLSERPWNALKPVSWRAPFTSIWLKRFQLWNTWK